MRTYLFFLVALSAVTSGLVLRIKRDDQGLAAHAAAERALLAQQSFTGLVGHSGVIGPSGLCGPSGCIQFAGRKKREDQGLAAHAAAERAVIAQQSFTGLVGPSGVIEPSGLCGPSGCIPFVGRKNREDQGLAALAADERAVIAQKIFTGLVGPSRKKSFFYGIDELVLQKK